MSHFYGLVQGNRTPATRGGDEESGYLAWTQDKRWMIRTRLWIDERSGQTMVRITRQPSTIANADTQSFLIYEGPIADAGA